MVTPRALLLGIAANIGASLASSTQTVVYRGPAACAGCPEAVAQLLSSSPLGFNVTFVGPKEAVNISSQWLTLMDVYSQPGGGDLEDARIEVQLYAKPIQDFVSNDGRYMGFCVGAYLAGRSSGSGLVPPGDDVEQEIAQPRSQVNTPDDTIINVDCIFSTGYKAGKMQQKHWLYFQDGAVMTIAKSPTSKVFAMSGDACPDIPKRRKDGGLSRLCSSLILYHNKRDKLFDPTLHVPTFYIVRPVHQICFYASHLPHET